MDDKKVDELMKMDLYKIMGIDFTATTQEVNKHFQHSEETDTYINFSFIFNLSLSLFN